MGHDSRSGLAEPGDGAWWRREPAQLRGQVFDFQAFGFEQILRQRAVLALALDSEPELLDLAGNRRRRAPVDAPGPDVLAEIEAARVLRREGRQRRAQRLRVELRPELASCFDAAPQEVLDSRDAHAVGESGLEPGRTDGVAGDR